MPDDDWDRLIVGLREGDPEVVTEFYNRHMQALRAIADNHIAPGLRRRVAASDVVQSVFQSFFHGAQAGRFQFADNEKLWSLMCAITLTKVREKIRYHLREKRNVNRETQPVGSSDQAHNADGLELLSAGELSSEVAVEFSEQFEKLMAALDDEEQQVLSLKMEDRTNDEIAQSVGISERTVRRIVQRLRKHLEEMFGGQAIE